MFAARLFGWTMFELPRADRTLASVAGLAVFALNEARMFEYLPRSPDPGNGQTHAVTLQLMGVTAPVYLSTLDLVARWGLIGLTVGLCLWAIAETFQPRAGAAKRS